MRGRSFWLPFVIAILGLAGNIALNWPRNDPLIQDPVIRVALLALTLAATATPGLYSYARAESRYDRSERDRRRREGIDVLRGLLRTAIPRLFPEEQPVSIRANIMTVESDHLAILCSVNMELYPDSEIRLAYGQGCAGAAWKRACEAPMSERWVPVLAPSARVIPRQLRERWGFDENQIKMTRHLMWVLSTPIFHRSAGQSEFIGVLNFDGVGKELRRVSRLKDPTLHKDCADIADFFATELISYGFLRQA